MEKTSTVCAIEGLKIYLHRNNSRFDRDHLDEQMTLEPVLRIHASILTLQFIGWVYQ